MAKRGTYTTYSVGAWIVWAVLLGIVSLTHHQQLRTFAAVFGGWVIGWTSATIARSVYPPPRARRAGADG